MLIKEEIEYNVVPEQLEDYAQWCKISGWQIRWVSDPASSWTAAKSCHCKPGLESSKGQEVIKGSDQEVK